MAQGARKKLGERGERSALEYLQGLGYTLLEKNHRRGRHGEADLILLDQDTLVFCEVKTRTASGAGHAAESYSSKQQNRLRRLILSYLRRTNWDGPLRVDLLALQKTPQGLYEVHHMENALELDDHW